MQVLDFISIPSGYNNNNLAYDQRVSITIERNKTFIERKNDNFQYLLLLAFVKEKTNTMDSETCKKRTMDTEKQLRSQSFCKDLGDFEVSTSLEFVGIRIAVNLSIDIKRALI